MCVSCIERVSGRSSVAVAVSVKAEKLARSGAFGLHTRPQDFMLAPTGEQDRNIWYDTQVKATSHASQHPDFLYIRVYFAIPAAACQAAILNSLFYLQHAGTRQQLRNEKSINQLILCPCGQQAGCQVNVAAMSLHDKETTSLHDHRMHNWPAILE